MSKDLLSLKGKRAPVMKKNAVQRNVQKMFASGSSSSLESEKKRKRNSGGVKGKKKRRVEGIVFSESAVEKSKWDGMEIEGMEVFDSPRKKRNGRRKSSAGSSNGKKVACEHCGKDNHKSERCYSLQRKRKSSAGSSNGKKVACEHCGKDNHMSDDCFHKNRTKARMTVVKKSPKKIVPKISEVDRIVVEKKIGIGSPRNGAYIESPKIIQHRSSNNDKLHQREASSGLSERDTSKPVPNVPVTRKVIKRSISINPPTTQKKITPRKKQNTPRNKKMKAQIVDEVDSYQKENRNNMEVQSTKNDSRHQKSKHNTDSSEGMISKAKYIEKKGKYSTLKKKYKVLFQECEDAIEKYNRLEDVHKKSLGSQDTLKEMAEYAGKENNKLQNKNKKMIAEVVQLRTENAKLRTEREGSREKKDTKVKKRITKLQTQKDELEDENERLESIIRNQNDRITNLENRNTPKRNRDNIYKELFADQFRKYKKDTYKYGFCIGTEKSLNYLFEIDGESINCSPPVLSAEDEQILPEWLKKTVSIPKKDLLVFLMTAHTTFRKKYKTENFTSDSSSEE